MDLFGKYLFEKRSTRSGGATAQFPNGDGLKENYWVDVVLLTSSP